MIQGTIDGGVVEGENLFILRFFNEKDIDY